MSTLNLTPHASAGHWSARLVGLPWQPAYTCWDLVREVQAEHFGRGLPEFDVADQRAPEELRELVDACGWKRADDAEPVEGDVLLMRGPEGLHIGVIVHAAASMGLLHNLGGLVGGAAQGSVRIDPVLELGRLGYGRFELWRAAA